MWIAGALVAAAYAPDTAAACGAPQPGLYSTVPAEGASHPANAALLFSGYELSLDGVTVTVDGAPAQLVAAPFGSSWAEVVVLVEPAPQVGQEVVVSGTICPLEFCDPLLLTYTAGEPDLTAPVPVPEAAFFAVYDHADFMSSGGDCESDTDLTLYVHVTQDEARDFGKQFGLVAEMMVERGRLDPQLPRDEREVEAIEAMLINHRQRGLRSIAARDQRFRGSGQQSLSKVIPPLHPKPRGTSLGAVGRGGGGGGRCRFERTDHGSC